MNEVIGPTGPSDGAPTLSEAEVNFLRGISDAFAGIVDAVRAHTAVYEQAVTIERERLVDELERTREIRRAADGIEALVEKLFHTVR